MIKKFYKKYGYFIFVFFLVASLFDMRFGSIAIICMLAPIIIAILGKGRYWCGNYCPRGNFYDHVIRKISPNKRVPRFLKGMGFRVFMIAFIMTNFGIGIYKNWGDLYGIGLVFYKIIVITSLVGIVLGVIYNQRTWCNFCPMGTISSLIAKVRGRKLHLSVATSCVSCGLCNKACPMNLSPKSYRGNLVEETECIFCQKCVNQCPKDAIHLKQ